MKPFRALALSASLLLLTLPRFAQATTFTVSNLSDSFTAPPANSLRAAIISANADTDTNGASIVFNVSGGGKITLDTSTGPGMLPILTNVHGISIDGTNGGQGAITIDGGSTSNTTGDRIFFIGVAANTPAAGGGNLPVTTSTNFSIANLTLQNGNALGGVGGSGTRGGGGGAGLGGAIFVNAGNLSLQNVAFSGNRAVGGAGGAVVGTANGNGGGAGLGGNAGNGAATNDGGGGGFGVGSNGGVGGTAGSAGLFTGGASGGAGGATSDNLPGGTNGGGGGGGTFNANQDGGGGGVGGVAGTPTTTGGAGGYGGGGGAGGATAGAGGFGGGGGGGFTGGASGFGAGSGAGGGGGAGVAGFGGGVGGHSSGGGSSSAGGGGAGLGGSVFVRQGATVTLIGGGMSGGSAVAGAQGINGNGTLATGGQGIGSGMFLAGSANFQVPSSQTVTISDTIGGGTNALITGGLTCSGAGKLVLSGVNTYTGATTISSGTLALSGTGSIANTTPITLTSGTTLDVSAETGGAYTLAAGQTVSGTGNVTGSLSVPGAPTGTGAAIGSTTTVGKLTFSGSVTFTSATVAPKLNVVINGTTAGASAGGYSQLVVDGSVTLANATMSVTGSYTPQLGDQFVIIDNEGGSAVSGTFGGLAEGSTLTLNGVTLHVSYVGGPNGKSIVLSDPPPPAVTGVFPPYGPTTGGNTVTISGTGFTGATAVTFGGVNATSFTVNSDGSITAVVPSGLSGTVNAVVTTLGGASATATADQFTALPPFVVTNTNDSGTGSLRAAISSAATSGGIVTFSNTTAGGAVNFFDGTQHGITLTSTVIDFTTGSIVGIQGPGANVFSVSGNSALSILEIDGGTLYLSGVTLANGASSAGSGGALFNNGATAHLSNCAAINSRANTAGGGAIASFGASSLTTLDDCALFGNSASGGGAISFSGTLSMSNCTLSGNTATGEAGAIFCAGTGQFNNCTISGNSANQGGGLLVLTGNTTMANSIVAANTATTTGPDIFDNAIRLSSSFSLVGNPSGNSVANGINGNHVGTIGTPINPLLGALTNNGGTTPTLLLQTGSPAIDVGSNSLAVDTSGHTLTTDQRGAGFPRVVNSTVDLGAVEFTPVPVVTSISPTHGLPAGGTSVTITGSGFSGATVVKFGLTAASSFTVNNDTQITATSPAESTGTVDVTVTTLGGTSVTSGADQFTYVVPPIAVNDGGGSIYATPVNRQFGRGASPDGVLSNDTLNGATITSYGATTGAEQTSIGSATATAQGGSIVLNADGSFTYTPATNFSGNDTFKYTLTNGGGSSTALVTIYVDVLPTVTSTTPVNNATLVSVFTPITINFSEPIDTTAAFTVVDTTTSTGVTFNQSPADGNATSTFTLTPTSQLVGGHVYTVTAIGNQTADVDGGQSMAGNYVFSFTTLPIPVPVNDPPGGGTYQVTTGVTFDSALLTPSSSVFDNDALFGATVTYGPSGPAASTPVDGTTTVPSFMNGTVLMRVNGTFTYTPPAGFTGTDRFFYKLTNASVNPANGTPQAQAILTVNVNQVPTLNAISNPAAIPVNSPLQSVSLSGITDGSGDTGQTLTVSVTSNNQTLIPNGNISKTYTSPNTTGTVSYTPAANQFGTAVITVAVQDNGGTANGGVDTVTQTFTVTVAPPAPSVTSISPTAGPTAGGTVVTLTGSNFTGATAVQFGLTNATTFSVTNGTTISATAPPGLGTQDITVTTAAGTSTTSPADQYTYVPQPIVTSLSPTSGPTAGNTSVVITGSNFSGATAVKFGVTNATGFLVNSPFQITATSPAGTGTVDVTVTTAGGTSTTGPADQYTYVPPPVVTSISPTSGPTAGNTSVVITGSNFSGATAVKFGVTNATGFLVNSPFQITATSPAGTGTVDVTVTTAGGTSTTGPADQYTYVLPPAVTSISPTSGPTAGNTSVVITGSNFSGATAVKFGVTNATGFLVNSPFQITATSPAGTGTVDVTVTTAGGTSTTGPADQFTYVPPPAVTSISPTSGPTAGNTSVTISGSNFINGATTVKFGANTASGIIFNNPTSITATSPAGTGTVDVTITTAGGTSSTSPGDLYTYIPPPAVTGLSPTSGPAPGSTLVTISGSNFTGATAVKFGLTPASGVIVVNASTITASSPSGTGIVDITVTTPSGTSSTSPADQFTYIPVPAVIGISPTAGPAGGITLVTLSGSNFTGATAVKFGGINAASFNVISGTSITATSPAGSAGTVDITVTTPSGTSSTSPADQYTYVAAPVVSGISPTAGPTAGNTSVVITGSNFSGASTVKFGLSTASFLVNSPFQITATSPSGTGTVDVTVTTTGGTSAIVPADQYTYDQPPTAGSLTPVAGYTTGGATVTITGGNFITGSTSVTIGGTIIPAGSVTVISPTSLSFSTPSHGTGNVAVTVTTPGGTGSAVPSGFTYDAAPTATQQIASKILTKSQTAVNFTPVTGANGIGSLTYSIAPTLPTGLSINPANGAITGSPQVTLAQTSFTVTVTDSNSTTANASFNLTINAPPTLSPGTLPADTLNVPYNQTITASGGTGTLGLAVTNVQNPVPGLNVPSNGTGSLSITGTPTATGTETFTVTVTDANGVSTPVNYSVSVSPAITLNPSSLLAATIGTAYNQTITASGGTGTLSLAVSNVVNPIAGLNVPASGTGSLTISGAPSATGTETFKVTATDSVGATTFINYSITVNPAITLSPSTLPADTINVPYNQTITASGGTGQIFFSVTNIANAIPGLVVPTGTTPSPLSITGTPTATGTETFTVNAVDFWGALTTVNYSIKVNPAITLSPLTLPSDPFGVAYNQTITASGGTGTLSLAVTNVVNPIPGLNVPSSGTGSLSITGTPTGSGTETFTVTATDTVGGTTTVNYSIQVTRASSTVVVNSISNVSYSAGSQIIPLSATVSGPPTVNEGTVTFTVTTSSSGKVGAVSSSTVSGGNASANFTLPAGLAAGTYSVSAGYTPGADFLSSSSTTPQTFQVTKLSPTLTSTASQAITASRGTQTLSDSTVLANGANETGTITFTLKLNSNTVDTVTTSVNGNGTYPTPVGYTLPTTGTVTGTYTWSASYSGDNNNNSASDQGGPTEQTVVSAATPTIATTQQPASATVGASIADQATVSAGDNPSGTVTFNLYNNATASGTPLFTDANEPLVSGTATSSGYTTTATGTVYWVATYNGDGNNNSVTSATASEPVTISAATPTIATTQQPASAIVGASIADQATISGGYKPTGTVTFNLYNNSNGTGTPLFTDANEPLITSNSVANSPTGATESGSTVTITTTTAWGLQTGQSVTISGVGVAGYNGTYTVLTAPTPTTFTYIDTNTGLAASGGGTVTLVGAGFATSAGYSTAATGTDYWVATYNGDSNNSAVTSGTALEPVTITPATPTLATTQQPASATVNTSIADKATVSGGFNPTGTVTFNLYNNSTASGTPLFTDTETLSGGTATSAGYTTTANGTDYWVVTYNGDSNNNPVTSSAASEPVNIGTVNPTALALTTSTTLNRQTGLNQLTVNVTNTTAGPLNGFRLFVDYSAYLSAYPSLRLYNSTSGPGDTPVYIDYPYPVAVGATVAVNLEFYTSNRVMPNPFAPKLSVTALTTSETPITNETGTAVTNITRLADHTILIEWNSVAGSWYRVSYSSDLVNWYDSPTPIQASSNQMQWIDSGAPFTSISPADPSVTSRFYIVNQIPTP